MNLTNKQIARFWFSIDRRSDDECWLWKGAVDAFGYGRFRRFVGEEKAHRVSYFLTHGAFPVPPLCVLHRCDVPACCNPAHLWAGTKLENSRDMAAKGRAGAHVHPDTHVRGERHGRSKLTADAVRAIRSLYASGYRQKDIGAIYGVSGASVFAVVHGETWKHVG